MSDANEQSATGLAIGHLQLNKLDDVFYNMPTAKLYEHALRNREGHLSEHGALVVQHGYAGEDASNKYIVGDAQHENSAWHGRFHQLLSEQQFEALFKRMAIYLEGREVYVEDCQLASGSAYDAAVRLITQDAWHCLWAKNMFSSLEMDTDSKGLDFTVLHVPHFHAVPSRDGTVSDSFVILHPVSRIALIGGTAYAGEIKGSVFAMMIDILDDSDVLPLHGAVSLAGGAREQSESDDEKQADVAILIGPEGSGKTTLISDPARHVLGDDMHGWNDKHIFSFEAGCYARVNYLDQGKEPLIYAASQAYGSIVENVGVDMQQRYIDFEAVRLGDSRAAYAMHNIEDTALPAMLNSPKHLVLLACDAFGVLPAISRLSPEQVMYYFLLGYSSSVAESDGQDAKPETVFSPCCGMPLMPQHASVYAKILGAKVRRGRVQCWLLNTGWSGGPAGTGERMSIELTRTLLTAALDGNLNDLTYQSHPVLGMQMPDQLDPIATWHDQDDPQSYIAAAKQLAASFKAAFAPFEDHMPAEVRAAGPR